MLLMVTLYVTDWSLSSHAFLGFACLERSMYYFQFVVFVNVYVGVAVFPSF